MSDKRRVIGYRAQKELKLLGDVIANAARPFVVVLGGAKVSDRLGVTKALRHHSDRRHHGVDVPGRRRR